MAEKAVGCAKPTGTVIGEGLAAENEPSTEQRTGERKMVTVRVGGKAPDFEAPAYFKGKFTSVRLSDYLGKWVLVCFYPGDFTFV